MTPYSMDLRERVIEAYGLEFGRGSQARVARRFGVSPGWVSSLLRRRRETGHYGPLTGRAGRKPVFTGRLREKLERLIQQQPDVTLAELKERTGVSCSLAAICKTLQRLDYRRKKRRFGPLSKIAPTSSSSESNGDGGPRGSIRPGSCSSTKAGRRRT